MRGPGGRVHRVPDAEPDRGHGAHGVPGGQTVRRTGDAVPRTAAAGCAGPGHGTAAPRSHARGGRDRRRARRSVRPDGPALPSAFGLLRRVRGPECRSGDGRRERRRTGHSRALRPVAQGRSGGVQRNGESRRCTDTCSETLNLALNKFYTSTTART